MRACPIRVSCAARFMQSIQDQCTPWIHPVSNVTEPESIDDRHPSWPRPPAPAPRQQRRGMFLGPLLGRSPRQPQHRSRPQACRCPGARAGGTSTGTSAGRHSATTSSGRRAAGAGRAVMRRGPPRERRRAARSRTRRPTIPRSTHTLGGSCGAPSS